MNRQLRIATQNLNWGGEPSAPGCDGTPRLCRLVPWLASLNADVLVLTEFKTGPLGDELKDRLAHEGHGFVLNHPQGAYSLGTAIASRQSLTAVELPIPAVSEPWRAFGVAIDGVEVFGFYFPLNEPKLLYWDWLLANARAVADRDAIFLGDFNTGKIRIDEAGETLEGQDKQEALEELGFIDTWRHFYPKGRDYTWYSSAGNGFRLDYIWSSPRLASHIQRVWHNHEARLTLASDHSAVIAELSLRE